MEKILFDTIPIQLQSLTPLHIGSGKVYKKGADVFYDNGFAGKADMNKLVTKISNISNWTHKIMTGQDIYEDLKKRQVTLQDVCSEILPVRASKEKDLFEFLRNAKTQNPVIAGSSVKGAIRTALLTEALKEFYKNKVDDIIKNFGKYKKRDDDLLQPIVEIKASRYPNPQNNIFKYLKVSDGEAYLSDLSVDNYLTLNMDRNEKWYIKERLTQTKEVWEGKVDLTLRIDRRFWKDNKLGLKNFNDFFERINTHTLKLLKKDLENFEADLKDDFFNDKNLGQEIIDNLKQIVSLATESSGSVLLRMSAGSGWDYMTGAWFKEITDSNQWDTFVKLMRKGNYENFPFPKTKRLTSEMKMPGFVLLKYA